MILDASFGNQRIKQCKMAKLVILPMSIGVVMPITETLARNSGSHNYCCKSEYIPEGAEHAIDAEYVISYAIELWISYPLNPKLTDTSEDNRSVAVHTFRIASPKYGSYNS